MVPTGRSPETPESDLKAWGFDIAIYPSAGMGVVCAALEQTPKVLIIAGTEGVFASGADIGQLRERRRDDALQGINSTFFVRIARLPMPVIAALDGLVLQGGVAGCGAATGREGLAPCGVTPRAAFALVAGT